MESTAQYWRPVWEALERYWKPIREKKEGARRKSGMRHLAQAESNRGRRGRKRDFPDAERLVKRLVARELTLSFAPDPEQRLWRTVTRKKYQLRRDRVQNQLESLLEEAHIDPAPGSSLRRTGPSRHQSIQAKAHCTNDSATPKSRLSYRTTESSTQPSRRAVIFDPRTDGSDTRRYRQATEPRENLLTRRTRNELGSSKLPVCGK
jgi:hypothetical protein